MMSMQLHINSEWRLSTVKFCMLDMGRHCDLKKHLFDSLYFSFPDFYGQICPLKSGTFLYEVFVLEGDPFF